jgi:diadenosine tetraphosphate (Ap4A) HIT family hydrolase
MLDAVGCIFCAIAGESEPSSDVYRDYALVCFMSDAPVNPGHTLIIPRQHVTSLSQLNPDDGAALFKLALRIQAALRDSDLQCDAVHLFLADGDAASQIIPHVHLHVIPRFAGDSFKLNSKGGVTTWEHTPPREELEENAALVRSAYRRLWSGSLL